MVSWGEAVVLTKAPGYRESRNKARGGAGQRRIRENVPLERREAPQSLHRLIGYTRQLDIHLKNDRLVDLYVERFMAVGGAKDEHPR